VLVGVVFFALWFIVPIFWYVLLRRAGLNFLNITIPSFLIVIIVVQQYLGLPALFFELDSFRADQVGSPAATLKIFFYTSVVTSLVLFGYIFARKTIGTFDSPHRFNTFHRRVVPASQLELLWIVFLFVVGLLVLIRYIQVVGIENVALFAVLDGFSGELDLGLLRSKMGNDFQGSYHWYRMFMRDILRLASLALYANYLVQPGRNNLFLFGLSFIAASVSTLIATEKGPFLWYLVSLFMVRVLIRKNGVVPISKLPLLLMLVFLIIVGLYMQFMGNESYGDALYNGLSRAFMGAITPLATYLDTFPDKIDYLYGRSFANPGHILPFEPYRLTVEMAKIMNPHIASRGIIGSSPTIFWGEMHANFGFGGVVLSSFLVGFGLYAIAAMIARFTPSPIVIGFTVWTTIYFSELAKTSLSNYIPPTPLILLIFASLIGLFISGRGKIRIARKCMTNN
jgi:hypothetical protein